MKISLCSLLVVVLVLGLHLAECKHSTSTTKSTTKHKKHNSTTTKTTTHTEKTTTTPATNKTTSAANTTTPAANTTAAANISTAATHTTATTTPTSTTTLPAAVPRFSVKSGTKTCLMLQGYIHTVFNYTNKKGKNETLSSMVPEYPKKVNGSCGKSSDELSLTWRSHKVSLTLKLWFNRTKDDYSLANVMLAYSGLDSNKSSGNFSAVVKNKIQAAVGTSYVCSGGVVIAAGNMSLSLGSLFVAAFMNTTNQPAHFPRIGVDCAWMPTTASATTTTTTTTSGPLTPAAIAGIIVGAVALVVIIIIILVCCLKRRQANGSPPYREIDNS